MPYITDGQITKNFTLAEMTNKQASDSIKLILTPEMIEHAQMMQELRDCCGKPLNVSSWYRTKAFNKKVGGASNSAHLDGRATDINNINTKDSEAVKRFTHWWQAICAVHGKIGGVEVYKWGMHFDSYSDKFGCKTFRYKDNR